MHVKDTYQAEYENQQDASFILGGYKRDGLSQYSVIGAPEWLI